MSQRLYLRRLRKPVSGLWSVLAGVDLGAQRYLKEYSYLKVGVLCAVHNIFPSSCWVGRRVTARMWVDAHFVWSGNIPHDWLFADGRVSAVCHHGGRSCFNQNHTEIPADTHEGAGTTAIGLRNGLPTIVVPFFGDQEYVLSCPDFYEQHSLADLMTMSIDSGET